MPSWVIVETKEQAEFVFRKISCREDNFEKATILACSYHASLFFESVGQKFRLLEDYSVPFNIRELQDISFNRAEKWHQIPVLDQKLNYKNCSLASPVQRHFTYYLFAQMYNLLLVDSILEREKPDEVWVFKNENRPLKNYAEFRGYNEECVFAQFFSHYASLRGIPLRTMDMKIETEKRKRKSDLKQRIKQVLEALWPLVPLLKSRGSASHRILLSLTPDYSLILSKAFWRKQNCEMFFLTETLPMKTLKEFIRNKVSIILRRDQPLSANHWASLWNEPSVQSQLAQFFQYQGHDVWKFISKRLEFLFRHYFQEIAGFLNFYERVLRKNRITAVVVNEDVSEHNRALVLMAHQLGIKSVVLQHGVIGKKPGFYPVVADKFACWGPYHEKRLLEMGIHPDKLVLTGCPKVEDWQKKVNVEEARSNFCGQFGIAPKKKIVLYTNTIFREEWKVDDINLRFTPRQLQQHFELLIREIRKLDGYQLVIKLHPRDKHRGFVEKVLRTINALKDVVLLQFYDTHKLLAIADVIVDPAWSSINLEALVMGRPLLRLNLNHREDLFDFNQRGVAVGCDDMNQFRQALESVQELTSDPKFTERIQSVLYDQLLVGDGSTPMELSAELVLELSEQSRKADKRYEYAKV